MSVREGLGSLIRSGWAVGRDLCLRAEVLDSPRSDVASCLVLDVRLPGLRAGSIYKNAWRKPILRFLLFLLRGMAMSQHRYDAMKAGAVEFLTKPFRDRDLLDAIHPGDKTRSLARGQRANGRTL